MFHVEHSCGNIRRLVESAVENSWTEVGPPRDQSALSPRSTRAAGLAESKTCSRNELRETIPSIASRIGARVGGSRSAARAPKIETTRRSLCDPLSLNAKLSTSKRPLSHSSGHRDSAWVFRTTTTRCQAVNARRAPLRHLLSHSLGGARVGSPNPGSAPAHALYI